MANTITAGNASNNGTVVASDSSGTLNIVTGSGAGATAISADTSQNVGMGTTSPSGKLHVQSAGNTYLRIQDTQANGYNAANLYTNDQRTFRVGVLGTVGGFPNGALIVYDETAAAWRMVIDSNGNMFVGNTSNVSSGRLEVTKNGERCLTLNNTATGTAANEIQNFVRNGVQVGNINTTGSATTYATSSDYRLKENIHPMVGALDKVAQLKPCTYSWKLDGSNGQGFIAHELQEVVPDAVTGEKDAVNEDGSIKPQGIDTSVLVATLTAAIQELKAELDAVKAKVGA